MTVSAKDVAPTIKLIHVAAAISRVETSAARMVVIDGLGGAGKSVLASALARELRAPVVQGDDFYRPLEERQGGSSGEAIGASFDWSRLERQVLAPLMRDEAARYQRYDWDDGRLGEWVSVPRQDTVVVEGVYLLRSELRRYASVSIWVETPWEVRLARGMERDGEAARSRWIDEWMPAEDAYVSAMRPDAAAALVVDGQGHTGIDPQQFVVVLEARSPLHGLAPDS